MGHAAVLAAVVVAQLVGIYVHQISWVDGPQTAYQPPHLRGVPARETVELC
jgi:hypothetical protein